jgi:TetR/AcrR family transcriptional regulator, cholesterol catabolism regulator
MSVVKKIPNPSATSKRARNKLDKRERIRDAAWSLFVEQGYAATTTREVAERAGVAVGTVFLYADDKPDLLFLAFHDRLQHVLAAQRHSMNRQASLVPQLLHIFSGIFAMYAETPELAAEFVRAQPGASGRNAQEVNALTFGFFAHLAQMVREAQGRGEVDAAVDSLLAARNIFSLYFGVLLAWVSGLVPTVELALDPVLRDALMLQLRGLEKR